MGKYDLNSLLDELKGSDEKSDSKSSDFWKPTIEKSDERVEYVIRFLPNPDSKTNSPWIDRAAHMFNFPSGKFVYEACPHKNLKKKCYFCEKVSDLYNTGDESKKAVGAKRFAKQRHYHNILVVSDPRDNGKNEGKVFIYESGTQVHDKCIELLKNTELDAIERLYFHPTKGTNYKLIMTWKSDYQNYEKSTFNRKTSAIEIDGKELDMDEAEAFIEKNCFKLNERLMDGKNFKSYESLKSLYENQGVVVEDDSDDDGEEVDEDLDKTINDDKVDARNPKKKVKADKESDSREELDDDDDDDDDDGLADLLND